MGQLTRDLKVVVVYMVDILVTGSSPQEHLKKLRDLLQRLTDKGVKFRLEKCLFAQTSVEYLGYLLSRDMVYAARSLIQGQIFQDFHGCVRTQRTC